MTRAISEHEAAVSVMGLLLVDVPEAKFAGLKFGVVGVWSETVMETVAVETESAVPSCTR